MVVDTKVFEIETFFFCEVSEIKSADLGKEVKRFQRGFEPFDFIGFDCCHLILYKKISFIY